MCIINALRKPHTKAWISQDLSILADSFLLLGSPILGLTGKANNSPLVQRSTRLISRRPKGSLIGISISTISTFYRYLFVLSNSFHDSRKSSCFCPRWRFKGMHRVLLSGISVLKVSVYMSRYILHCCSYFISMSLTRKKYYSSFFYDIRCKLVLARVVAYKSLLR